MCQFVDRILQMRDGRLVKEYTTREEITALARGE
jgi:ABC-type sugar transport system ATPase subunit